MEKKKICWARVLKNISYVLFPFLVAGIVFIIFCLTYPLERESIKAGKDYYDTDKFAQNYANEIYYAFYRIQDIESEENYYNYYLQTESIADDSSVKYINYFQNDRPSNVLWIIINNETKEAYTNLDYGMDTGTVEGIKTQIKLNKRYWKFENEKIETSEEKLNSNNLKYLQSGLETVDKDKYTIYTSVSDNLEYIDSIYVEKLLYNILSDVSQKWVFMIPILIILIILLVPIIINGVGKTSKQEGIKLNWYDKMLIEIATVIAIIIGLIGSLFIATIGLTSTFTTFVLGASVMGIGIAIIYLACIMLFETIVKRLKTHTFIKTTIAYWMYKKVKESIQNIKITKRFILYFASFIIVNLICFGIMWSDGFIGILLTTLLYVVTFNFIVKRLKSYIKVKEAIHSLYNGDTEIKLNDAEICNEMKDTVNEINDIAGGLSNALEEKLKSERLKTELITNVSHDIKTPLTSIINYVDLLKKENIEGEKAQEYLNILDNKSQRLKKLTEDLVEASKASSGAIKLNIEKLNVNELIKQVSGEFEDKFNEHDLQEIITFPENEVYINADSRYLYRVLENMYSNIAKYAMEGTRVYTDILDRDNKISIQIKNVSKQKLNITTDELMQRFVRGEASRNTEGSGLGLSIARSLTELQQGSFNIYLDGDLFKVIIEFDKVK